MMDALPGESNNRVDMDSNTNMLQMAGQDYLNANNTVISIQQNNDENDHEKTLVNPRTNGKFQKIDWNGIKCLVMSIPGYLECSYNVDYRIINKLGYGGSAQIFLVELLEMDLVRRAGNSFAVAKVLEGSFNTLIDLSQRTQNGH